MKEGNIQQLVRIEASKLGAVLWRNNVGVLKDADGRPIRYGLCNGSSDLIGIYNGRFLAIEVKTSKGKLRPAQRVFLDAVKSNGGIGGVARCAEDVDKILKGIDTY